MRQETPQHVQHQHRQLDHNRGRIVASIAATLIALACGTNYVYSAWAPQFAERLKLSSTESNLIGLAGNLGQYTLGVPIGMFVDHRGSRPAVLGGAVLLALGYFPLHQAYDRASGSVPFLFLFSYLSGLGGCMAFSAAVKTSALNWPQRRGTATAFPLAAFGLSAFFFSTMGSLFFPGDPSAFLMLLAWGTCGLTFGGFFFLKVHPHSTSDYHAVSSSDSNPHPRDSSQLTRTMSIEEPKHFRSAHADPGTSSNSARHSTNSSESNPVIMTTSVSAPPPAPASSSTSVHVSNRDYPSDPTAVPGIPSEPVSGPVVADEIPEDTETSETSSLMARPTSLIGDASFFGNHIDIDRSHRTDIRGFRLLRSLGFWQLFTIMGVLAGVGIMTINNIGNDAKALWIHFDPEVNNEFLIKQQQMHVSVLSLCSFLGRLSSGVGSDFLVKRLDASRLWCLVVASLGFFVAQVFALNIRSPYYLGIVSGLSGVSYGFLFGVYPSIVAETFGINGLSQNWGFMTMSPILSSNIFNLLYGTVYDRHSIVEKNGERSCHDGLDCYRAAYIYTLIACVTGLGVTLWVIRRQHQEYLREMNKGDEED
ncbi:major facilitator superfamily domain-containing protein [Mariannaea sp. PMI_226]|nr:major facilitator superfamily domain-containing protein [Mariannaea sp. PMI_226]